MQRCTALNYLIFTSLIFLGDIEPWSWLWLGWAGRVIVSSALTSGEREGPSQETQTQGRGGLSVYLETVRGEGEGVAAAMLRGREDAVIAGSLDLGSVLTLTVLYGSNESVEPART